MAAWLLGCDISQLFVWCLPNEVILWTVRCCGQSSRQAETSGTHNNEEPAHSGQGHPQPLQPHAGLQVSTANSFCEFKLLISMISFISSLNLSIFSLFSTNSRKIYHQITIIKTANDGVIHYCSGPLGSRLQTCPQKLRLPPANSAKSWPCGGQVGPFSSSVCLSAAAVKAVKVTTGFPFHFCWGVIWVNKSANSFCCTNGQKSNSTTSSEPAGSE